jgi:hypothetical protein
MYSDKNETIKMLSDTDPELLPLFSDVERAIILTCREIVTNPKCRLIISRERMND